jgi:hypothetical protein
VTRRKKTMRKKTTKRIRRIRSPARVHEIGI